MISFNEPLAKALFMHPEHQCSQDCGIIHREIFKKILLSILSSRSTEFEATVTPKGNTWVRRVF